MRGERCDGRASRLSFLRARVSEERCGWRLRVFCYVGWTLYCRIMWGICGHEGCEVRSTLSLSLWKKNFWGRIEGLGCEVGSISAGFCYLSESDSASTLKTMVRYQVFRLNAAICAASRKCIVRSAADDNNLISQRGFYVISLWARTEGGRGFGVSIEQLFLPDRNYSFFLGLPCCEHSCHHPPFDKDVVLVW